MHDTRCRLLEEGLVDRALALAPIVVDDWPVSTRGHHRRRTHARTRM